MAGQHEQDLRYQDVEVLRTEIKNIDRIVSDHKEQIGELRKIQDDRYETIRKRLHEIVDDHNKALSSAILNLDNDITSLGAKVHRQEHEHTVVVGDITLLSHTVDEHVKKSEERHNDLMGVIRRFDGSLRDHMKDEERALAELLHPVRESLDGLHSRWWAVLIWLVGTLGAGAGYLFLDKLGWL